MEDSISYRSTLEISEELDAISIPVFVNEVPENLTFSLYKTENIPRLFALRHVSQVAAQPRIIKALELAYSHLRRSKLKQSAELTPPTLKKPRIHEVIILLESLFKEIRILHDLVEIRALSPKPEVLASITKKLSMLRNEARDYLVENASAVSKPPLWGRNNNPEEWLDVNDFEIISVAYRHEVEIFLKTVAPYFPRGSTTEKITPPKPHMPLSLSDFPTSVNNFPTSRITKTLRVGKINATKTLPIPSVASQGNRATLLNRGPEGISSGKVSTDQRKEPEDSTSFLSSPKDSKSPQTPPGLPAPCESNFRSFEEISLNQRVPPPSVVKSRSIAEISLDERAPLSSIINSQAPTSTEVATPRETTFRNLERITTSDQAPLPGINSSTQLVATPKPARYTNGNLDCLPHQPEISEPSVEDVELFARTPSFGNSSGDLDCPVHRPEISEPSAKDVEFFARTPSFGNSSGDLSYPSRQLEISKPSDEDVELLTKSPSFGNFSGSSQVTLFSPELLPPLPEPPPLSLPILESKEEPPNIFTQSPENPSSSYFQLESNHKNPIPKILLPLPEPPSSLTPPIPISDNLQFDLKLKLEIAPLKDRYAETSVRPPNDSSNNSNLESDFYCQNLSSSISLQEKSARPPGDSSDNTNLESDSNHRNPSSNILSHSLEQSAPLPPSMTISDGVSSPTVSRRFDLILKPESTPPWNKEVKTPAVWFTKFSRLLRNSTNMFQELGKVLLGRLTKIAKSRCCSITDKGRKSIKDIWNTISCHRISHRRWRKHRFRTNRVGYKEPRFQHETPSEYIIRKLGLIGLIYNYSIGEVMQFIAEGLLDFWTTRFNAQFIDAVIEFRNAISCFEEILIHLSPPVISPTTLLFREVTNKRLLPNRVYSNKRLLPNQASSNKRSWATLFNTLFFGSILEIRNANTCNREIFIPFSSPAISSTTFPGRAYFNYRLPLKNTNANLVESIQNLDKPLVPKDNGTISSRKHPEFIEAQFRHGCNHGRCWNDESSLGLHRTHANILQRNENISRVQEMCNNLYHPSLSDSKRLSEVQDKQQEFRDPIKSSKNSLTKESTLRKINGPTTIIDAFEPLVFRVFEEIFQVAKNFFLLSAPFLELVKVASCGLVSTAASSNIPLPLSEPFLATQKLPVKGHGRFRLVRNNLSSRFLTTTRKLPLDSHSRRLLARDFVRGRYSLSKNNSGDKPLIIIRNSTVLLTGYSLVGMQIAQVPFAINSFPTEDIIDSKFDITFIPEKLLTQFCHLSRIVQGQRIRPIQVTDNATFQGCVLEDLYSHTIEGLVKMNVESYVDKGMSTPFNLGNYSANQYSITVVLGDSKGRLEFGNYGRRLQAEISVLFPFIDKDSLNFQIKYLRTPPSITSEKSTYRKDQQIGQEGRPKSTDGNIKSTDKYLDLPHISAVPVILKFTSGLNYTYVKKVFPSKWNPNYGCASPDSLLRKQRPQCRINKFSAAATAVQVGQVLRTPHRLGRKEKYLAENREQISAVAISTWSPVEIRNPFLWLGVDSDPLFEPSTREDQKANEVPEVTNRNSQLLEELEVYPKFPTHRDYIIKGTFLSNLGTFGLDCTFRRLTARIIIPLKEGTKEIFVPPFGVSHDDHKVMNKQLSRWTRLIFVGSSKNLEIAPPLFNRRNKMVRAVVDCRKLNGFTIQWLTTLSVLAGFCRMETEPKEQEKLTFRARHALRRIIRMFVGYKGTAFSAYPSLRIVHHASRIPFHMPNSLIRHCILIQADLALNAAKYTVLEFQADPLADIYETLGDKSGQYLLSLISAYVRIDYFDLPSYSYLLEGFWMSSSDGLNLSHPYTTSGSCSVLIGISNEELEYWKYAFGSYPHFRTVLVEIEDEESVMVSEYQLRENGLTYLKDWDRNSQLCVLKPRRIVILGGIHPSLMEFALGNNAGTYDQATATYHWHRKSLGIKNCVSAHNISGKSDPSQHVLFGLPQSIPIPSIPLKVVTMEFIPKLPISGEYEDILIVKVRLATNANFILTSTSIAEKRAVTAKFGIPRQVIMDRDVRRTGRFWKESSNKISLQACIGPSRDNQAVQPNASAFSCNSAPHSATSFAAAHEYTPITEPAILPCSESMPRLSGPPPISGLRCSSIVGNILDNVSFHPEVQEMVGPLLTEQPKVLK